MLRQWLGLESRSLFTYRLVPSAASKELFSASEQQHFLSSLVICSAIRASDSGSAGVGTQERGGFRLHLGLSPVSGERGLLTPMPTSLPVFGHQLPTRASSTASSARTPGNATALLPRRQVLPLRLPRYPHPPHVTTRCSVQKMLGPVTSPRSFSTAFAHSGKLGLMFPTSSTLEIRTRHSSDVLGFSFVSWSEGRLGRDTIESKCKSMAGLGLGIESMAERSFNVSLLKGSHCCSWEGRRLAQVVEARKLPEFPGRRIDRHRRIGRPALDPLPQRTRDEQGPAPDSKSLLHAQEPPRAAPGHEVKRQHLIAHRVSPQQQQQSATSLTHTAAFASSTRPFSVSALPAEARVSEDLDDLAELKVGQAQDPLLGSHLLSSPTTQAYCRLGVAEPQALNGPSLVHSTGFPLRAAYAEGGHAGQEVPILAPSISRDVGNPPRRQQGSQNPPSFSLGDKACPAATAKRLRLGPGTASRFDRASPPGRSSQVGQQLIFGSSGASQPGGLHAHRVGVHIFRQPPPPDHHSLPAVLKTERRPGLGSTLLTGTEPPRPRISGSDEASPEKLLTCFSPLTSHNHETTSSEWATEQGMSVSPSPVTGEQTQPARNSEDALAMEQRSPEWFALRSCRLTASSFSKALGFWPGNRVELWEEKLGLRERFKGNSATAWGQKMEPVALAEYARLTGNVVTSFPFQIYGGDPSDSSRAWLGASPDGLIEYDGLGGSSAKGVLEVKCPYNRGMPTEAQPHPSIPAYYIPQAQGLLQIFDRDWLDFYSWTMGGSVVYRVERDPPLWGLMHGVMEEFWFGHVLPAKNALQALGIRPEQETEMTGAVDTGLGSTKDPAPLEGAKLAACSSDSPCAQDVGQHQSPSLPTSAHSSVPGASARAAGIDPELLRQAWRAVEQFRPRDEHYLTGKVRTLCQNAGMSCRVLKYASPFSDM